MTITLTFLMLWVINGLTIWLANLVFPSRVVLGTWAIEPLWAIIYSASALTIIDILIMPILKKINLGSVEWMGAYWVVNTIGVWLVARLADNLGMGISSWLVAVFLGLVLTILQGVVVKKNR